MKRVVLTILALVAALAGTLVTRTLRVPPPALPAAALTAVVMDSDRKSVV